VLQILQWEDAGRDAVVVVVLALEKCDICLMHTVCLDILKVVVVVLLSKCGIAERILKGIGPFR